MSARMARKWTEGKSWESEDEVAVREAEEMSARTMRMQPSWANAVAVALPMPRGRWFGSGGSGEERAYRRMRR